MSCDIVIIGAGPAGLCFARALKGSGLRIALVERQPEAGLIAPPDDGREIAITHHSQRLLRELGLWARLREEEIGALRDAMVLDGNDRDGLMFRHGEAGTEQLGWLLSNHAIRRAAYEEVMALPEVERITGARVEAVRTGSEGAEVVLDNGDTLRAPLLVAADSRFSETRRAMGIGAQMRDFGLLNTRWAIIVPLIGLFMPFSVFWMRAHFVTMPNELSEGARIDGANVWQLFWRVHVPLAMPAISSLAILLFLWTWNQFLLAIVLVDDPAKRTMAGALGAFQGQWGTDIPLLCAGSLLILAPTLVIFLIFQRRFVAALLQGSLKG